MADSNLAQLSYRVEDTYNEAPDVSDALNILRYTGESLSFDITNTSSQEIRPDRAVSDLIQTGAATSGGFNFELSANTYDDFIAGAMFSDWSTALPTATSVGISYSATASTITSSSTSTFENVSIGQWIKSVGRGTATTVEFFRVTALSATTGALAVTVFPAPVASQAAGSVCTLTGSVIRNGIIEKSFAFERKVVVNSVTATNVYFQYSGMIANTMAVSAKSEAILTGSFDFMGANPGVSDDTAFAATTVSSTTTPVLNAVANVGGVYEGRPTFTSVANCLIQGIDISLNNNLRTIKGLGSVYACDVGVGQCDVSGSMNAYFFDKALYLKYINGTETAISFRVIDSYGHGYAFTLPRVKFETDKVNVGGSNQDIMENLTFKALYDSTTDCQIQIDRF